MIMALSESLRIKAKKLLLYAANITNTLTFLAGKSFSAFPGHKSAHAFTMCIGPAALRRSSGHQKSA